MHLQVQHSTDTSSFIPWLTSPRPRNSVHNDGLPIWRDARLSAVGVFVPAARATPLLLLVLDEAYPGVILRSRAVLCFASFFAFYVSLGYRYG